MKYPIYLRVAKKTGSRKGYKVSASTVPDNQPLDNDNSYSREWFPTVMFAVNVDLPDELFEQASRVIAELNVGMKAAVVSTEIVLPKGITVKGAKK